MTTVLNSLNAGLHQTMSIDEHVYILGEDLLDPYGGAFKVTEGLSTKYPERVLTTPVSEAGIVGIAGGMALRGLRPVVEIMFGDFITLAADQIINSLTKFPWMYNQQVSVPLVIRTPMGGRRGYGPTHSQSLEKFFLGVPGLRVLAPTALGNPGELLSQAILETHIPILFIENKVLYTQKLSTPESETDLSITSETQPENYAPTFTLSLAAAPPATLTLCAYGHMAELAKQALITLAYEYEIFTELIVPTQLAPFELSPLFDSINRTGRLLSVEEGTHTMGWGAEVLAQASEKFGGKLQAVGRVAAKDIPIPASLPLEASVLPTVDNIIHAARKMV